MSEREELRALAVELHGEWCLDGEDGPGPDWHAAESCHGFAGSVMESRWLRAHDDRIRAEAWDEGYEAHDWTEINPYRHPGPALRVAAGTPTREEEVGTGIGGGSDPAQTEATPWDNRSGDRPEDPPAPTSPSFQGGTDG